MLYPSWHLLLKQCALLKDQSYICHISLLILLKFILCLEVFGQELCYLGGSIFSFQDGPEEDHPSSSGPLTSWFNCCLNKLFKWF